MKFEKLIQNKNYNTCRWQFT